MPQRVHGIYCSRSCCYRARNAKADPSRLCEVCSAPLRKGQKRSELCCSRVCGDELRRRNTAPLREAVAGYVDAVLIEYGICLLCGGPAVRKASRGRWRPYCGKHDAQAVADHQYALGKAAARARYVPKPRLPKLCGECGTSFVGELATARYCTATCRDRATRRRRKAAEGKRAVAVAVRKAVYLRDGGCCHLCGFEVLLDADDAHENTWAATLDHLVPHSQGGADDEENLATAHRWCNTLRGDLPVEAAQAVLRGMAPPDDWDNGQWHYLRSLTEALAPAGLVAA